MLDNHPSTAGGEGQDSYELVRHRSSGEVYALWEDGNMKATVRADYSVGAFDLRSILRDSRTTEATLTDEHPASSYGVPVLIIGGAAYGPSDLRDLTIRTETPEIAQRASHAGYMVVHEEA